MKLVQFESSNWTNFIRPGQNRMAGKNCSIFNKVEDREKFLKTRGGWQGFGSEMQ